LNSPDWNFSFSGLKTAVRRTVKSLESLNPETVANLSASFQMAAVEVLVQKTVRAAKHFRMKQIAVSGGVACNGFLRQELEKACSAAGIRLSFAERNLCTDNAAMIALLAENKVRGGAVSPKSWDIEPDWELPTGS
jgi:N6-L-threonylcarbamoyladenine synthase